MPKYAPPSASVAPRFTGIRTFMRLPNVQDMTDVDFAIVGIPFDTGASYKTGARFGPSQIRETSTLQRNYSMNLDVNIFDHLSGVDYGDLPITPGFIHETYKQIEEGLAPILDAGVVPLCMGGDHSITLGELRAVAKKYGPVATFDIDFVDPAYAPGTGTIEVGGFTGYETMLLIREMKDLNFVAADFVEVLPGIDPAGVTSYMAANVMHEFISALALQRKNGKR